MPKYNSYHPPSFDFLAELITYRTPPPGPPPSITPRTDPPGTPFPFLSLPRELRDLVYAHSFPPKGLRYRPNDITATTIWHRSRRIPASHLPLLLTSRQIHAEAQSVLFRTSLLELDATRHGGPSRNHISGQVLEASLCRFPLAQANLVTRVYINSLDWVKYYSGEAAERLHDLLPAIWGQLVRDARTLGSHFPRLVRLEARDCFLEEMLGCAFFSRMDDFHALDEGERRERGAQIARAVVRWMEAVEAPVPPRFLGMLFCNGMDAGGPHVRFLCFQMEVMDMALKLYAKSERGRVEENRDESGRVWLEELSGKRKRGRKGWCDEGCAEADAK
ncbi:hypothetical protein B5807_02944 [Epicoccum nigrum]|uniref:F-box domain-containing protein n=1 Tax=Epicoccum nigrum TaxID=105696 RepID=A0A1Y2MAR2_EPING|nr:hypothetical protein B5807_02944 [Epicoccum nigrum]